MTDLYLNPHVGAVEHAPPTDVRDVHRRLPGYAPTPLVECGDLAAEFGVAKLWVKDESDRLGLPSFKILGASYATYRTIAERVRVPAGWRDVDDLRDAVRPLLPFALAAATDGNHGHAVARMARLLGFDARIYAPTGTAAARIEAIEGEGATVEVVDGDYDTAVRRSAADEGPRCAVVSDTSWPGYERVPGWVIDGYSTIFAEADEAFGGAPPTVVVVPVGVGALAAATVRHYRGAIRPAPRILGVEPADAACVLASLRAGVETTVPGPHHSIMAGLNCGTPSRIAWPSLRSGLDAVVAIPDDAARGAMRMLARAGVVSGETGAAALGGLVAAHADGRFRLRADDRVLVLSTEGATDPDAYQEIAGEYARSTP